MIYDQYGRPVSSEKPATKKADLLREYAGPTTTGIRSWHHTLNTSGITPQQLGSMMRRADEGDMTSYLELAEQIEEKDAHYLSVIGTRKRTVAGMEITVEPSGDSEQEKAAAQLVQDWIDRDELQTDIFDVLDAIGKGFSVSEIIWDTTTPTSWTIDRIEWRDPRWFEFNRHDGTTLMLRGSGGQLAELPPHKFIVHHHKAKSGLPIRGGVVRPCLWMWLFKNFSIKDWVVFAEAFGQPIRVGKYGAGATEEDRDVLLRAVANIGSDAGAIIPDSMLLEFVESQGKTASADLYERLARYCDEQISKAVVGQTSTTDSMQGGGLAGNEAHAEVRGDIAVSDAKQLAATLNRQLVVPLVMFNLGAMKRYPLIRIGQGESVNITELMSNAQIAVNMGAKVSASEMLDRAGLPPAKSDEDALQPAAPAAPTYPGMASMQLSTAAAQKPAKPDAIDQLSEEAASEWEEVVSPIETAIQKAMASSRTPEEFTEKLLELAEKMDVSAVAEKITKTAFSARMAGNLNIDVEE